MINVLDSREVAKIVGRNHKEVLRDIRNLLDYLASAKPLPVKLMKDPVTDPDKKINPNDYFILDSYVDNKNEVRPRFLVTKMGCELYGTRMNGQKGIQFAIAYIQRFNDMEQELKTTAIASPQPNSTKAMLLAAIEHEERLESLEGQMEQLKKETTLTSSQRRRLKGAVSSAVIRALGGKKSHAYKDTSVRMTAFRQCYRELQELFDVASYVDIPKVRFDEAMDMVPRWHPNMELMARVDHVNGDAPLFLENAI